MSAPDPTREPGPAPCPDCGAEAAGSKAGCQQLFEDVIAREFSRPELFQVHRLTVDSYSLQHPHPYLGSAKSMAAHVAGICWALEFGGGPEASQALSRWLNGAPTLERIEVPPARRRGALTIRHVHAAADSAEHIRHVREWAESVWSAWAVHHPQGRAWVLEALSVKRRPGRA